MSEVSGRKVDQDPGAAFDGPAGEAVDTTMVARGTRYTALGQVGAQALRMLTNIVLARLLSPAEFGVVAIGLVVGTILDQLKDLGTGAAVIQRKKIDHALVNSVFYLNVALGLVLTLATYLAAPYVAALLGNPQAAPVLVAFSGITAIASAGQIHHALLRRTLRFRQVAQVTALAAAVTAVVSIAMAVAGLTYWSFVIGYGLGTLTGTVAVWILDDWRPTLTLDLAALRSIAHYSGHLFASSITFIFFNQVDKVIVSRFLGTVPLGLYALAQRTVMAPVVSLSSVVAEVTFPVFSRHQDNHAALRAGFDRSSRVVALVTFPATLGVAALAGPLVAVVFGSNWADLVPLIWIMAPATALQSVTTNATKLLLATGRSDTANWWSLSYFAGLTTLELIGTRWGLTGVAAGFATAVVLLTPIGLLVALRPIGMRVRDFLRGLLPQLFIALLMVAAMLATAMGLTAAQVRSPILQVLAGGLSGAIAYCGLLWWIRPPAVPEALDALRRSRG